MKFRKLIIIFTCIVLCATMLYSLDPKKKISQYGYSYWNELNGLPQNFTHSVMQSREGYIWCTTQEGLVRFDGMRFMYFDKTNTPIFNNNYFTALTEGPDGSMWIGTSGGGLYRYFEGEFSAPYENTNMNEEIIYTIAVLGDSVFYGTENGLKMVGSDVSKWITVKDGLSDPAIRYLYPEQEFVWVGTRRGLDTVSKNGSVKKINFAPFSSGVDCIYKDKTGVIWFGTHGKGLYYKDTTGFHEFRYNSDLPGLYIRSLIHDLDGNLWIGTSAGLARYNQDGVTSFVKEQGLVDNFIFRVYEDREGTIWLATRGGLVQLYNVIFTTISGKDGLPSEDINAVLEDSKGNLWVCTYGNGIARVNGDRVTIFSEQNGLLHNTVYSAYEDTHGVLWFGTSRGISRFDGVSWKSYAQADGLRTTIVKAMLEDSKGNFWVCTEDSGVYIKQGERFVESLHGVALPKDDSFAIFEDSHKNVWIGTLVGLYKYDGKAFTLITKKKNGIVNDFVISFYEDIGGRLWVGTENGLSLYERGRWYSLTSKDGLPNDVILSITADKERRLWIGSNKGVFTVYIDSVLDYIYEKTPTIVTALYGRSDGMKSAECNGGFQPSVWKRTNGELVFPTMNGVAIVNPEAVDRFKKEIPVNIERVHTEAGWNTVTDKIVLPSGLRSFEIEYTAFSFENPHRMYFRYFLKGFDAAWIEAGNRRTAYYTNVPPGKYVFEVEVFNSEQRGFVSMGSVVIHVTPRFYETKLFIAMLIVFLATGIFAVYRIRIRNYKNRQEELARLIAERTHALEEEKTITENQSDQLKKYNDELKKANIKLRKANEVKTQFIHIAAHDLKNPLQSIIGYSDLIISSVEKDSLTSKNIAKVHESARKMLHIVIELLENAEIESGAVAFDLREVDASLLVQSVIAAYNDAAVIKDQQFVYEATGDTALFTDESAFRRIADNLISNAVKYSPHEKDIFVKLIGTTHTLQFSVEDQGPGLSARDKERVFGKFQRLSAQTTGGETSTGLGLSIVKSLVELLGGTITVKSEIGKGACFTVTLKRKHKK